MHVFIFFRVLFTTIVKTFVIVSSTRSSTIVNQRVKKRVWFGQANGTVSVWQINTRETRHTLFNTSATREKKYSSVNTRLLCFNSTRAFILLHSPFVDRVHARARASPCQASSVAPDDVVFCFFSLRFRRRSFVWWFFRDGCVSSLHRYHRDIRPLNYFSFDRLW